MPVTPVTVRVSLGWNKNRMQVRISPWSAHITKPGQGIIWRPTASIQEIKISKNKPSDRWPFNPAPPNKAYKGNKARPPKGRNLKPGTKGKRFPYKITLRFSDPKGKLRRAMIDPDMVVEV
ncbi:MAG TPA: hypothetical protein VGP61_00345 [Gemmatimonadales bacterium]|jgi:hypothetical protein|nr:hypothetical protein [Gemmatimonadales bacterium]